MSDTKKHEKHEKHAETTVPETALPEVNKGTISQGTKIGDAAVVPRDPFHKPVHKPAQIDVQESVKIAPDSGAPETASQ